MLVVDHEWNCITDIFLVANLSIVRLLTESCLIFTDKRFLFIVFTVVGTAFEWKLEKTGGGEEEEKSEKCYVEYLPHFDY